MTALLNWLQHFTAEDYYHAAAFVLTGAGTVYTVQLIKVLKGFKYSDNVLRALNFLFNALYTAAAAIATGGISLGNDSKTVLALTAFSAGFYRFHNSFLFKSADKLLTNTTTLTGVVEPLVPTPKFSESV